MNKKLFKTIFASLAVFAILYMGLMVYAFQPIKGNKYFIPEKYSGWICVTYSDEGFPALEEENGFLVVKIPNNGILHTSSKMRTSPVHDEYYYYLNDDIRKAEELRLGGGYTSRVVGEKSIISYFWVSSGNIEEDYEKYVKDRPTMNENGPINPICGPWKEGEKYE